MYGANCCSLVLSNCEQADLQLQQPSKPLDWRSISPLVYPNEIQAFPQSLSLPENHVVSTRQLHHSIKLETHTLPPTLASFRSLWSSNKSRPLQNQTGFFPNFWPKPIIGRTPTILVSQQHIHQRFRIIIGPVSRFLPIPGGRARSRDH